ncbi:MAG: peptide chain release factor 2 [Candidatus Omnitrophica bacterium]|nr:peptide chain release factor 2 [Candidatus Omnitrophota bacterium]MBU4487589.1 peptide chain release factor 2 [Candidatus Omnitrophota bacterium]MCG2705373.1 peptide chain release factor 2 [Candidatus Omnitrophota bacterium]
MLKELKERITQLEKKLAQIGTYLAIDDKVRTIKDVEAEIAKADFWTDSKRAEKLINELKSAKSINDPYALIAKKCAEIKELIEIVDESDSETIVELSKDIDGVQRESDSLEFKSLLSKKEDRANAILSINAGAGGTESCDWANMLFRMYSRWSEKKGFSVSIIDYLQGETAGIKNITVIIKGDFAYGYLKAENGVHRLVRISPFDANKRRHTSFASADVIPEIADDIDIKINESDLRIDTYRSSGAGGQHVNVTDSAVRITHNPSGIVVQCQNERSQHKNKIVALRVLKARLYEVEKEKKMKAFEKHYSEKSEIAWGSQIRSYVMHPYSMVKDHRTDYETSNVSAVMDGDLDGFMEAYLKMAAEKK